MRFQGYLSIFLVMLSGMVLALEERDRVSFYMGEDIREGVVAGKQGSRFQVIPEKIKIYDKVTKQKSLMKKCVLIDEKMVTPLGNKYDISVTKLKKLLDKIYVDGMDVPLNPEKAPPKPEVANPHTHQNTSPGAEVRHTSPDTNPSQHSSTLPRKPQDPNPFQHLPHLPPNSKQRTTHHRAEHRVRFAIPLTQENPPVNPNSRRTKPKAPPQQIPSPQGHRAPTTSRTPRITKSYRTAPYENTFHQGRQTTTAPHRDTPIPSQSQPPTPPHGHQHSTPAINPHTPPNQPQGQCQSHSKDVDWKALIEEDFWAAHCP